MSIVSFQFMIFAVAVVVLYFIFPKKWQWIVILGGNVYFYACAGIKYLALLIGTSMVTFFCAIALEHMTNINKKAIPEIGNGEIKTEVKKSILSVKKLICTAAVVCVGGIWVIIKYLGFFTENINALLTSLKVPYQIPLFYWLLPLGISFYTFHIIGYVVDVYRGKYAAEHNFFKFFTYVSFFPHIIQGPFTRFNETGQSVLEPHQFSYDRLSEGCARILWGLFKKLVIADKLSISVNIIFGQYQDYSGVHILMAMVLYCLQLYADFAGYMDIVCGLSHILGIKMPENFRQPYFAKSVEEFWRRWHITLGQWFKDYVFFPLSMGKVGQKLGRAARKKWGARAGKLVPGYFALFFVWTATGLWHGANWTFLIWGYLNLIVIVTSMQLGDFYERTKKKLHIHDTNKAWQLFRIVRTFGLVCFFRFFSSQESVAKAMATLGHVFTNLNLHKMWSLERLFPGLTYMQIILVMLSILAALVVEILQENEVWDKVRGKCPFFVRALVYAVLISMLLLLAGGSTDLTGGFMYAVF